ncbi:mitochondrial fusion protein [Sporothrix brasiliensis 5110]|uniref:Mitochondrial fusion protein n=1 Tax=Sporothrix brasiliensis 5110 TaxID=1398154 RepID=A0A0C2J058_9PEZI|nr:mitochondrial fusion protein [Sporothrix brasiliensis 5110]KIH92380.1 mitochondrial fusion protein [Sporothrix brasiliensis 5110]
MASHGEGVNPLRPYYIPPSIGDDLYDLSTNATANAASPPSYGRQLPHGNGTSPYSHKARDIFADLDYKDYLSEPSPSVVQSARDVVDELLWRYTSVLMAQPFEVAKTILQVRSQAPLDVLAPESALPTPVVNTEQEAGRRQRSFGYDGSTADDPFSNHFADDDSDPDEPSYFTSNAPNTSSPLYPLPAQRRRAASPYATSPGGTARTPGGSAMNGASVVLAENHLVLTKPDSILEVISQLWQKEGAWGVWKGTNASFLYTVVQSLLENWSRSLLCALFNVPDLGLKDDVDRLIDVASPYPWASLFVAAAAAVATGLILSPLDLVRTRLIITPTSRQPRRALSLLRSLPSYVCSPVLVLPTILHSLIHPVLTLSTPLVLRTRFMIDKDASPMAFSIAKFCSSSFALFVKLPIETVLRRGQAALVSSPEYVRALGPVLKAKAPGAALTMTPMEAIFPLGVYKGVVGTMTHIVWEEGTSAVTTSESPYKTKANSKRKASGANTKVAETVFRQGQGVEGLWRGWKVSWWGLVGLWTAAAVGRGGDGEF